MSVKIIIGLGNIGDKYAGTRHNIGFDALDNFVKTNHFPDWKHKKNFFADISEQTVNGDKIVLVKPTTFMNLSGKAVQAVKTFYKTEDIIVVCDDIDRDFGNIRIRSGGGHGGNNGLRSVIESIGPDFDRLRIGVSNRLRGDMEASSFVLQRFSKEEAELVPDVLKVSEKYLEAFIEGNIEHDSVSIT